jgi:uncharacterized protein (TIGR03435 family)
MPRFPFLRRVLPGANLALCLPWILLSQNADQQAAFEVASIKPADPQAGEASIKRSATRLTVLGYTPRMLIQWAYDVRDDRLIGQSKWLDSARYDIVALAPEQPRPGELQQMMQSLLKERFGLVIHHEQRNLPFFALVVDNGGPKVRVSEAEPGPAKNSFSMAEPGRLRGTEVTAAMLANVLSNQTGRSVQDFTGLKGIFDFRLEWSPDESSTDNADALPSIFTAVREQLGLKLEPRRGPVDVIVLDQLASSPHGN